LIASAQVVCLVREMKCVLLLYTMMEKTRDDLHSKPAEARPRRAREGWAAPGSEQAMDGSASLTIDPTNILGTGGFKRCRGVRRTPREMIRMVDTKENNGSRADPSAFCAPRSGSEHVDLPKVPEPNPFDCHTFSTRSDSP
jgi:hypothetical protein